MSRSSRSGAIGFTTGLLVGGFIGAAIMLFFPPKSGTALRKDVRKKSGVIKKTLERSARRVKKGSTGLIENARRTVESVGKSVVGPNGQVMTGAHRISKARNR